MPVWKIMPECVADEVCIWSNGCTKTNIAADMKEYHNVEENSFMTESNGTVYIRIAIPELTVQVSHIKFMTKSNGTIYSWIPLLIENV